MYRVRWAWCSAGVIAVAAWVVFFSLVNVLGPGGLGPATRTTFSTAAFPWGLLCYLAVLLPLFLALFAIGVCWSPSFARDTGRKARERRLEQERTDGPGVLRGLLWVAGVPLAYGLWSMAWIAVYHWVQ